MNNPGLGQWILDFVNSDVFLDWLFTSIFGVVWWLMGRADTRKQYPLSLPEGLAKLFAKKQHCGIVYMRSFVMQVMGIVLWLWCLFLAFTVPVHDLRVSLFWMGHFVLGILAAIFIAIGTLIG